MNQSCCILLGMLEIMDWFKISATCICLHLRKGTTELQCLYIYSGWLKDNSCVSLSVDMVCLTRVFARGDVFSSLECSGLRIPLSWFPLEQKGSSQASQYVKVWCRFFSSLLSIQFWAEKVHIVMIQIQFWVYWKEASDWTWPKADAVCVSLLKK